MTTPPDRPKPPKLVPGEPLWGTPEITPPEQRPPAASRPGKEQQKTGGVAATGSARPPAGRVQPAPPPPQGPVQFGAAPAAAPAPGGYGRATTYGGGAELRDGHHGGARVAPKSSIGPLVITGAVCLVIGIVVGFAAALFM